MEAWRTKNTKTGSQEMNQYISSDKLKYHPEHVAEYLKTGYSGPISAQFQITNVCPYRCVYCDKVLNDEESEVTDAFIDRLKEIGIQSIILTGGEPVVYKKFQEDIPRLAEHFKLGLVTTLCKYQPLLEDSFEWVKVSMDSVNKMKFRKIRNGGGLNQILKNLDRLYKNKSKYMPLGTQIVLTNENKSMEEMVEFIETVYNSCDYIQIRPIESVQLYKYEDRDYENLETLKKLYPKVTISDKFQLNHKPVSCPSRWSQLLINKDHDVMLCCNRVREKISSIYDDDFMEKMKSYKFDINKCYRSCVLSGNNAYLDSIKNGKHKEFV